MLQKLINIANELVFPFEKEEPTLLGKVIIKIDDFVYFNFSRYTTLQHRRDARSKTHFKIDLEICDVLNNYVFLLVADFQDEVIKNEIKESIISAMQDLYVDLINSFYKVTPDVLYQNIIKSTSFEFTIDYIKDSAIVNSNFYKIQLKNDVDWNNVFMKLNTFIKQISIQNYYSIEPFIKGLCLR